MIISLAVLLLVRSNNERTFPGLRFAAPGKPTVFSCWWFTRRNAVEPGLLFLQEGFTTTAYFYAASTVALQPLYTFHLSSRQVVTSIVSVALSRSHTSQQRGWVLPTSFFWLAPLEFGLSSSQVNQEAIIYKKRLPNSTTFGAFCQVDFCAFLR